MDEQAVSILLVEDAEAHVELIRRAFSQASHIGQIQLSVAKSLGEARACLAESLPDLVIVDWVLPDGKGTELLPLDGKDPSFPVVVMTSYGDEQVAVEVLRRGALDYVVKSPAALADIPHIAVRTLREWEHIVERKRAEAELRAHHEQLEKLVVERTAELTEANAALVEEIAERKRAEQQARASLREKEILLYEVHHRVKNNLQIVSSLLDMQSMAAQEPSATKVLQGSRDRVKAMALVHEKLYRTPDLASIDAADYVAGVIDYLLGAYENQAPRVIFDVQVDNVALDLDTAIYCGLIINELVSNALKHAFPSEGSMYAANEIRVGLCSEADGMLALVVSDNGAGLPKDLDLEVSQSLGMRLVKMLNQQLEGTIELDRSAGTAIKITFRGVK